MRKFFGKPSVSYFLLYFGLLSIGRWQLNWSLVSLWTGGLMGVWFVWVDRVAHIYFTRPNEQLSVQVKSLISMKRYKEAILLLDHRKHEQRFLTVKSLLFLVVWLMASLFVFTSTGSMFASSMMMGIGFSILIEMVQSWHDVELLKSWLFWQIKRNFSDMEARVVVVVYGVLFGLLSLMLI